MSTSALVALIAIALVAVVSAVIGTYGVRVTRSTSDFLVASRTVGTVANASAISGEYLSAASFLGIAGLILHEGADALRYPVAFVAGYLALQLFVAAPLRRSGARTVPDLAEVRLDSLRLRRVSRDPVQGGEEPNPPISDPARVTRGLRACDSDTVSTAGGPRGGVRG
jgi:Na+(H+)/acetate symporter ActP